MRKKKIGRLIVSAIGLRRMADALEKKHKTDSDIEVDTFIESYENKKTIGIDV